MSTCRAQSDSRRSMSDFLQNGRPWTLPVYSITVSSTLTRFAVVISTISKEVREDCLRLPLQLDGLGEGFWWNGDIDRADKGMMLWGGRVGGWGMVPRSSSHKALQVSAGVHEHRSMWKLRWAKKWFLSILYSRHRREIIRHSDDQTPAIPSGWEWWLCVSENSSSWTLGIRCLLLARGYFRSFVGVCNLPFCWLWIWG